jgi:succinate dehydrogenase/fumarate reductase flavoprotein subunit
MARKGKRTLLIDLDCGLRCLDLMADVSENLVFDLGDVLKGRPLSDAVLPVPRRHGLWLLAAPFENNDIDGEALAATVERYNGFVENGEDEDFGRSAEYMTMPIGDGPYYIIEQKPRFATTMGGLVINTDLQVMNKSGEVIEGLYAAGEVVGGVMGDDSPSGANNGWAVTSGKLSAESIAAALGAAEEDEAA